MSANQPSGSELNAEMRAKLASLLIYPALTFGVGIVIVVFFMSVMLPKFQATFDGMNLDLTPSTRMLTLVATFLANPLNLLLCVAAFALFLKRALRYFSHPARLALAMKYAEPAMIIGIAVGVGLLQWAVLSAMFSITEQIGADRP